MSKPRRGKSNLSSYARVGKHQNTPNNRDISNEYSGVYVNSQFAHAVASLIGCPVRLRVRKDDVFHGILSTASSKMEIILEEAHKEDVNNSKIRPDIIDTVVFRPNDILSVNVSNVDINDISKDADSFTDSAIAKRINGAPRERDLQPWVGEEGEAIVLEKTENGWSADDMFKRNEEKFNVKSSYAGINDEYTMKLEKEDTPEYREREEQARIKAEMIEQSSSSKYHQTLENGDEMDEEDKFSAVHRPGRGKYTTSFHAHSRGPRVKNSDDSQSNWITHSHVSDKHIGHFSSPATRPNFVPNVHSRYNQASPQTYPPPLTTMHSPVMQTHQHPRSPVLPAHQHSHSPVVPAHQPSHSPLVPAHQHSHSPVVSAHQTPRSPVVQAQHSPQFPITQSRMPPVPVHINAEVPVPAHSPLSTQNNKNSPHSTQMIAVSKTTHMSSSPATQYSHQTLSTKSSTLGNSRAPPHPPTDSLGSAIPNQKTALSGPPNHAQVPSPSGLLKGINTHPPTLSPRGLHVDRTSISSIDKTSAREIVEEKLSPGTSQTKDQSKIRTPVVPTEQKSPHKSSNHKARAEKTEDLKKFSSGFKLSSKRQDNVASANEEHISSSPSEVSTVSSVTSVDTPLPVVSGLNVPAVQTVDTTTTKTITTPTISSSLNPQAAEFVPVKQTPPMPMPNQSPISPAPVFPSPGLQQLFYLPTQPQRLPKRVVASALNDLPVNYTGQNLYTSHIPQSYVMPHMMMPISGQGQRLLGPAVSIAPNVNHNMPDNQNHMQFGGAQYYQLASPVPAHMHPQPQTGQVVPMQYNHSQSPHMASPHMVPAPSPVQNSFTPTQMPPGNPQQTFLTSQYQPVSSTPQTHTSLPSVAHTPASPQPGMVQQLYYAQMQGFSPIPNTPAAQTHHTPHSFGHNQHGHGASPSVMVMPQPPTAMSQGFPAGTMQHITMPHNFTRAVPVVQQHPSGPYQQQSL